MQNSSPVVLITGCSSGIGLVLAEEFSRQKCIVYATARQIERIKPLEEKGIRTLAPDVTKPKSIETAVNQLEKLHRCNFNYI
ncbi:SDR family NAD(P)-dependent oxidoreductase [candidate division KSB1 bacterium]|nr:SDR family NAD(P)-dependent oxidoreductase [candidate division KSB1 bacterium]